MAHRIENIHGEIDLIQLVNALFRAGLIQEEEVKKFLASPASREGKDIHPVTRIANANFTDLVTHKKLNAYRISEWVAEYFGIEYIFIDPLKIDAAAVSDVISYEYALRHHILPVRVSETEVWVTTTEPGHLDWLEQIEKVTKRHVRLAFSCPEDINKYTNEFYRLAKSISGASGKKHQNLVGNFEQLLEIGEKNPDANDEHIVNIVDWLLNYAFEQRASDIHIEPRREHALVRFRIDGVLHQVYEMPISVGYAVVARVKSLGRMNIAEKRKPQDGRLKTRSQLGQEVELRLSTLPTAFGEKLVMRVFDPQVLLKPFAQLGLDGKDLARWQTMSQSPNGIIFVTGPTGSGKTTTLYSTLKQLAQPEVNVCTIEDPIEMVEASFNQMQVQHSIDLSFAEGVRALLRQDPDIIMIGEIRDLETAQMAVQAALTGHLVLSTLHTNDATAAITRLLDLGVPHYLIKSTLLGVMAQRLVRTLCPHCKTTHPLDPNQWHEMIKPWKMDAPDRVFQPVGCTECRQTGFLGRAGLYESFLLTPSLAKLIHQDCDIQTFRNQALKEGMLSLRLNGAKKVAEGLTTISEVLRVTPDFSL